MVTFRKLQSQDISDLKKLFKTTIEDFSWYSGEQKQDILKNFKADKFTTILENRNYICVVGLSDKKLIGFAFGFFSAGVYTLHWLGVASSFRNKKIATKMILKLIGYTKTKNCHRIVCQIVNINTSSLGLFQSLGFEKYATIRNHFYHKDYNFLYKNI